MTVGDGTPVCIACRRERQLISAEPVRRGYEIRSFKCPNCGSVLRLAQKGRRARRKATARAWHIPKRLTTR